MNRAVTAPPAELSRLVERALAEAPARIRALVTEDGRRFWLKRVEQLTLRLRLQKGDPARAFLAEREGLHFLADRGLPVPQIALEGPDFMVLQDVGPNLMQVASDPARPVVARLLAFYAAGAALGDLHRAGLVHGRPAVRDICWDGQVARFIDLERFQNRRTGPFRQALDLLILAHSCNTQWADDPRWLNAAMQGYEGAAPAGAMARAVRLARRLGWLGGLARLILRLRPRSRETRAVALTIDRMSARTE